VWPLLTLGRDRTPPASTGSLTSAVQPRPAHEVRRGHSTQHALAHIAHDQGTEQDFLLFFVKRWGLICARSRYLQTPQNERPESPLSMDAKILGGKVVVLSHLHFKDALPGMRVHFPRSQACAWRASCMPTAARLVRSTCRAVSAHMTCRTAQSVLSLRD